MAMQLTQTQINTVKRTGAFEKRVHEVDLIRGILMIVVMIDHLFLKLWQFGLQGIDNGPFFKFLYDVFSFYWYSDARSVIRPIVLLLFTFISGISCAFSKSNWKRAGLMLTVYAAVLVVTNIMQIYMSGGVRIDFNVIGVLAWSTLIFCFFQKLSWRSLAIFLLASVYCTIFFVPFLQTIPGLTKVYLPFLWNPEGIRGGWDFAKHCFVYRYQVATGIPQGDHMPLFPYICFFFVGALISTFIYKNKKSIFKNRYEWERPFCFVGRHAIWFYLGHQMVYTPVFFLLGELI